MRIFKYLKFILTFREVADVYREDNGKNKPFTLTRRFWGVLISAISGIVMVATGVSIPAEALAGDISIVWDNINAVIPHVTAVYGVVMAVIGEIKKK